MLDCLGFPWILRQFRLFNGLRGLKRERYFSCPSPRRETRRDVSLRSWAMRKRRIVHGRKLNLISDFLREIVVRAVPLRPSQSRAARSDEPYPATERGQAEHARRLRLYDAVEVRQPCSGVSRRRGPALLITEPMRKPERQTRDERDHQEAQEKQAKIAEHRPYRGLDRHAANQTCAVEPKPQRRRK